jgi:hypothetical protein
VTPLLSAVCGQNVHKVVKKIYKTGDLWSRGTQTNEGDFPKEILCDGDIVKRMRHTYTIVDLKPKDKAKVICFFGR